MIVEVNYNLLKEIAHLLEEVLLQSGFLLTILWTCITSNCFSMFSSVQSLSCVRLSGTPWTVACQASLSITNSRSLLTLMSVELVMPCNHLIFCRPLLPPSIFPSIRVFSNDRSRPEGAGCGSAGAVSGAWLVPQLITEHLTFWELFSKVEAPFYNPISNVWGFQFLHIPTTNTVFLIIAILMDVKCYLICISRMINSVEHLFMCFLAFCVSSVEKCLHQLPIFHLSYFFKLLSYTNSL